MLDTSTEQTPVPADHHTRRPARLVASSLFALTKPRIVELLLVTTLPTMLLAERGWPPVWLIAATLAGGALAAGSANTLNCFIDRDIDALMRRTSRRLLAVSGAKAAIRPAEALVSGIVLGAAATLLLGLTVNWLAAALADGAILFYVFVYTLGLKRRTASSIVIGGAAGCIPVLVGWAAVTGRVSLAPVVLFAVIRDGGGDAGPDPVRGVAVRRLRSRARRVVPGAHQLRARVANGDTRAPMRLFHQSIAYLTLLFAVVAVTAVLPLGR